MEEGEGGIEATSAMLGGNYSLLASEEDTDSIWLEDTKTGAVEMLHHTAIKLSEQNADAAVGPNSSAWMQRGASQALTHLALIDPDAKSGWLGLAKTQPKAGASSRLLSSGQSFFRR